MEITYEFCCRQVAEVECTVADELPLIHTLSSKAKIRLVTFR